MVFNKSVIRKQNYRQKEYGGYEKKLENKMKCFSF